MSRQHPSVAITGVGVVSAIGCGREPFWSALVNGRSGIDSTPDRVGLYAPVRDFDGRRWIARGLLRRMDRLSQMLVAAMHMAISDARLDLARDVRAERVGIITGTALGNLSETATFLSQVASKGPSLASPSLFPNLVMNAPASYATMALQITGPAITVSEGDISGELAVGLGHDLLAAGAADVVLVGGADELGPAHVTAYRDLGLLAAGAPAAAWSGPFGANGTRTALGEGAAILVLEPRDRARARQRDVYAEIAGVHQWAVPSPTHGWPEDPAPLADEIGSLLTLLPDAPEAVYCSATGQRQRDTLELGAYARACAATRPPWITSIKGATGTFGTAGALSVAAAALAVTHQTLTPLCRLERPPAAEGVGLAGRTAQRAELRHVVVSGLAPGGQGIAIGLRRPVP